MTVKIFQIGFNRCGTRTIHRFFRLHGFRCVHWDKGNLARTLFRNLSNGDALLRGYEDFNVYTDMEWIHEGFALEGYKLFPFLARDYPDAVFILNTREREDWIQSRSHHGGGHYLQKWKEALRIEDDQSVVDAWRADWDHHHRRAEEFFAGDKRFARFHIGKDSPEVLAALLPGHRIDSSRYRKIGAKISAEE